MLVFEINLQLFGGRGGSSSRGGGGGGKLSPLEKALNDLDDAGGYLHFEDLPIEQQQIIVDAVSQFLVDNEGQFVKFEGLDYIYRDSLKGMNGILEDIASRGYLDSDEGEVLWVTYRNDGSKDKMFHSVDYGDFDDVDARKELQKMYRDYKAGKIKGIYYMSAGGDYIAGRGFVPETSKQSGNPHLSFTPGKLKYKTRKSQG